MTTQTLFEELIEARRSNRVFDTEHQMPEHIVATALASALKSPNSSNMQMWEFVRVKSDDKRKAMVPICLGQSAASTASEFVVVVARPDYWKTRSEFNYEKLKNEYGESSDKFAKVKSYYKDLMPKVYRNDALGVLGGIKRLMATVVGLFRPMVRELGKQDIMATIHGSNSLASMTFMYAMTAQGYDTCPLGGFDSVRLKKLLNLPSSTEITMVIACGKGTPSGIWGERHRVPFEEVVRTV